MADWFTLTAADVANLIAGGLGGAVRAMALKLPLGEWLVAVAVGAICAKYLYPVGNALIDPVVSKFTGSVEQSVGLGGFIIGILGIALVGFVLEVFKMRSLPFTKRAEP